jgi:lysophospholipase L1-like esterase
VPGFADFDRRARAGETLNVVFFGASLTWGANATDQSLTSYRAVVARMLEERYPRARFRCFDAAIGGTGSQLGVFRLERDVLRHRPDLVFLDFSASDDNTQGSPESFASYEALLQRLVDGSRVPVVAVLFPFKWEIPGGLASGTTRHLAGLTHRAGLAAAYGVPVGDAAERIVREIRAGRTAADDLWNTDGVHPGDAGYRLFAAAAFDAFCEAADRRAVCRAPAAMVGADTFLSATRGRLTDLFAPPARPAGWRPERPHLTAACHDQVMSRWLDGKPQRYAPGGRQPETDRFDMSARRFGGNWNYHQRIAGDLDPSVEHELEIEPVLSGTEEQELRIESVCVAGGPARVRLAGVEAGRPLPPEPGLNPAWEAAVLRLRDLAAVPLLGAGRAGIRDHRRGPETRPAAPRPLRRAGQLRLLRGLLRPLTGALSGRHPVPGRPRLRPVHRGDRSRPARGPGRAVQRLPRLLRPRAAGAVVEADKGLAYAWSLGRLDPWLPVGLRLSAPAVPLSTAPPTPPQ